MALLKIHITLVFSLLLTQIAFANSVDITIRTITPDDSTVLEGDEGQGNPITVLLQLSAPSEEPVQIRVQSSDHEAFAGVDYTGIDQTFTLLPGVVVYPFTIRTIPNKIDNPYKRRFMLMLKDPVGVKIKEPVLIITIIDDDEVLSIDSTFNILEKDHGEESYIDVVIKREFDNEIEPVVFDLKTKDGTAIAGKDYVSASFEGVLYPGELEKSFRFTVIGDDEFETYEHFYVDLTPRSEKTRINDSPLPIYIQDNDGDFYFSYSIDTKSTARGEEMSQSTRGHSTGEIPLTRIVDKNGSVSYEGEAVLTHSERWDMLGQITTQPSRTRAKFFGINNDFTSDNARVEWSVGPDEHLRCVLPPPMSMPMNCVWWATFVNHRLNKNWTPPNSEKWGTFLLDGFHQHNKIENNAHIIAIRNDVLNYTTEGPMDTAERSSYKIIRKARQKK